MLAGLADECHSYPSDVTFLDIRVSVLFFLPTFVGARLQRRSSASVTPF